MNWPLFARHCSITSRGAPKWICVVSSGDICGLAPIPMVPFGCRSERGWPAFLRFHRMEKSSRFITGTTRCVGGICKMAGNSVLRLRTVSYTHLRAHETPEHLVCRLLLEKKN